MQRQFNFRVYPTLLDAYSRYLRAPELHEERWAWTDDAEKVPEFSWEEATAELIDRINRKPFESEAADRGTAFNVLVDAINGTPDDECVITRQGDDYTVEYNGRQFAFNAEAMKKIAAKYSEAIAQVYVERPIDTRHGKVLLYGYIDELEPDCITDLKTTTRFYPNKFRHNWQHIVYPYCTNNRYLRSFRYDIYIFNAKGVMTDQCVDFYAYDPERDEPRLREHVEGLIDFVLEHRDRITDKRIFAEDE